MELSERAEKGRKAARGAALLCTVASALSLLTLDIPLALIGFWAAAGLKQGSVGARNIAVVLRIVDFPLMILIGVVLVKLGGLPVTAALVGIAVCALLDVIALSVLLGSKDLDAFFKEVNGYF